MLEASANSRVFWILVGPSTVASSRIHGSRIHDFLVAAGRQSEILFRPPVWVTDPPLELAHIEADRQLRSTDVVVFQKVSGPRTVALLEALAARGTKTVYLDCDLPLKRREAGLASLTVCSSSYLAAEYRRSGIAAISIADAYEETMPRRRTHSGSRFTCAWFGVGGKHAAWETVEEFRRNVVDRLGNWTLVTISDHPRADRPWSLETCWSDLRRCDAVTIPSSDEDVSLAKSANRVVQAMALRLPVAAYPIPSYVEVVRDGRNGFLCRTADEWTQALRLLEDEKTRERIAGCGYRHARRFFSIQKAGRLWIDAFDALTSGSPRR